MLLSFFVSIFVSVSTNSQGFSSTLVFIVGLALTVLMYTILFSSFILFCVSIKPKHVSSRLVYVFSIVSFLIIFGSWFYYWLSFYPGLLTNDSYNQWGQANGYQLYSEWHPLIHTFLIKFASFFYHSPASFLLLQLIFGAFSIVFVLGKLLKKGVPIILCSLVSLLYAFYPVNGIFMVTLWKDIPYSILLLLFFYMTSELVLNEKVFFKKPATIISFTLISCFTALFRKNGLMVVIITLLLLLVFSRKKQFLISVLVTFISIFSFNFFTNTILHAEKSPVYEALSIPLQQISATYKKNGKVPLEEKVYFNEILPTDLWSERYNDKTVDYIKYDSSFDGEMIEDQPKIFILHWFKLLKLNPKIFIVSFFNQTASIWRFTTPTEYKINIHGLEITGNRENYYRESKINPSEVEKEIKLEYQKYKGKAKAISVVPVKYEIFKKRILNAYIPLNNDSKSIRGQQFIEKVYHVMDNNQQQFLIRGAVAVLILLLATAVSIVKFGLIRSFLILVIPYLNLFSLIISALATDFRYIYSLFFSMIPIFLTVIFQKTSLNEDD